MLVASRDDIGAPPTEAQRALAVALRCRTGTPSPIARALQRAVAVAQSREQRERVGAFVGGGARPGAGRGLRWPGLALARGDGELVAVELAEVVGEHRQPPLGSD
jgi:hypothetical protein